MTELLLNIIIIIGLALFACLSWKKIESGIYAVVFCLPLYLVKLNIAGIASTVLELGIYILFIILLSRNDYKIKSGEIIPDKILRIGIFLFLSGAVISSILSVDVRTSAGILKGWFFDPFLFYVIIVSEIKTFKQRENILRMLFLSGLAVAAISLLYLLGLLPNGVSFDNRLHAFYLSPNYLAMYLSPALIIGIWLFSVNFSLKPSKEKNTNERSLVLLICIVAIMMAIYFTYSFAAWFALFASVFLYIYLIIPYEKRKILFGSFLLLLAVLFYSQSGTSKFENLKNLASRSSYSSRLMIWRSSLDIGMDNFVVGIGPGNFQKYYLSYQTRYSKPYLEWAVPQPHNIFLAFWLEAGLFGFIGFIVILFWFVKYSLFVAKSRFLHNENHFLVFILLSLMAYTIIHGLFDTTYWKNDLAVIFWLNLALLVMIKPNLEKVQKVQ